MIHEVSEGVQEQTTNEAIAYGVDCGGYPGNPASVASVTVVDVTESYSPVDVNDTVLSGSASIDSTVITTPTVQSLTAGQRYRVRIVFIGSDANTYEIFFDIECEI